MPPAPTALLVVRFWPEPDAIPPHRFSVRWTNDLSLGLTHERSFSDAGATTALVHGWLAEVERDSALGQ